VIHIRRVLQYMLWPSICLSVTNWCPVEMVKWIELIFGTEATLSSSCAVFVGNLAL